MNWNYFNFHHACISKFSTILSLLPWQLEIWAEKDGYALGGLLGLGRVDYRVRGDGDGCEFKVPLVVEWSAGGGRDEE